LPWGVSLKLKGGYLIMPHENIKYFQETLTCWSEDLLKQLTLLIKHLSEQIEIPGFEYETGRAG
jgi:hypothetical protein